MGAVAPVAAASDTADVVALAVSTTLADVAFNVTNCGSAACGNVEQNIRKDLVNRHCRSHLAAAGPSSAEGPLLQRQLSSWWNGKKGL